METPGYLAHLRRELQAFQACLSADLSAPVRHCGDWTLRNLADHLGRGNLWAAKAVTEGRSDRDSPPAPAGPGELAAWFAETSDVLLAALDTDPATSAWTFLPPHTVGFWQRRRCMETLVHRWDAEQALGNGGPVDPVLASDGVAEVVDTMFPGQVSRGRAAAPEHALGISAADTGMSWLLGPGAPVATVSGTSPDLLLTLWGRLTPGDPALTWQGDRAAGQAVLARPLVP